jgi:hypothetical protein
MAQAPRPPAGPSPSSPPPGPKDRSILARVAEPIRVTARIGWALAALTYDVATDIRTARRERARFQGRRAA